MMSLRDGGLWKLACCAARVEGGWKSCDSGLHLYLYHMKGCEHASKDQVTHVNTTQ